MKYAFFDIDGTLSAPRYIVDDEERIGLPLAQWQDYCARHQEHTYDYCALNVPVAKYVDHLYDQGVDLYVLTTAMSSAEIKAKQVFIHQHFPHQFKEVLTVERDEEKINVIKTMADINHVHISECELIEDTLYTLLLANEAGIKPTHVSHLNVNEKQWFRWNGGEEGQ